MIHKTFGLSRLVVLAIREDLTVSVYGTWVGMLNAISDRLDEEDAVNDRISILAINFRAGIQYGLERGFPNDLLNRTLKQERFKLLLVHMFGAPTLWALQRRSI